MSGLLTVSPLALATVWCARFYQAEPAPVVGTAKHPVPLCLTSVLPPSERRDPSPARTLLPGLCSYGHMCQSRMALPCFGYSPRSRSLCRLRPAPAATGTFLTLFCESFLEYQGPCPGGSPECACLFLPPSHRPSPRNNRVSFPQLPSKRFHDGSISRLQPFLYVLVSKFARLPDRSYRSGSSLLGSQGFYPSRTCFVASACIGYC